MGKQEEVCQEQFQQLGRVFNALEGDGGKPIADYSRNVRKEFSDPSTVGAESMARTESMARRRFAADTTAPVHFLKDFFS